jgi:hypothetical protein
VPPKTGIGELASKPGTHPLAKAAAEMILASRDCRRIWLNLNLEVLSEVFMVVGDCLRIDKNNTALRGSIFLNKLVVRKFLLGRKS